MNFNTLSKFALSDKLSDFKILLPDSLGSKAISGHKIIFAANSDLFSKLFDEQLDLKEYKLQTPVDSFEGKVSSEVVESMVRFGYREQTLEGLLNEGLSSENSFRFFSVAKLLNFVNAENLLSKYIEQNNFKKEKFLVSLFESIKFDQGNWVFFLVKEIAHNFNEYLNSSESKLKLFNLPVEHIKAIIGRDDLFVSDEDKVFQFAIDYIKSKESLEEIPL